jgi:glycosyltransferase involved in cell wall biosynthesis
MTSIQGLIVVCYAIIVAVWPIRLAVLEWILRRQRIVDARSPQFRQLVTPLVSVILPAKDEETYLALCLNSIRALTYPNIEILVVDDRSTDQTGAIALAIAATDPRVQVITIEELPEGWTGKTHALEFAAHRARGEWFLFLDADTQSSPESLAVMMEVARTHGAALVSVLPELRCETFWERVMQPLAAITLMQSFPLDAINNPESPVAFANGQYILIEASAYRAIGGHAAVRGRFVEDIAMAQRVKRMGRPIRVELVRGIVTCRMYASLGQIVRGWSRIFFDALERSPMRLALKLLDPLWFCQSGHLALLSSALMLATGGWGTFAWEIFGLSILHHVCMLLVFNKVYQASLVSTRWAAWFPLANFVIDWILIRALWMCLTGTVTWRGTSYPSSTGAQSFATRDKAPP